jgi:hypothetical protein
MRTEVARLEPVLLVVGSMGTEMRTETKQKMIYFHNQWQVSNFFIQKTVKVGGILSVLY